MRIHTTLLAVLALGAGVTANATAESTVAYWRFEDDSNPGKDSGPGGIDLTVVENVRIMPNDGPAASKVNPVPKTGEANASSLAIAMEDGALYSESTDKLSLAAFTVEAIIRAGTTGKFGYIVSRWGKGGSSWRFAFNSTDWTLSFALSQNGRDIVPFQLGVPGTKVGDYLYVAAKVSVDATSGAKVELLAQNLSRNGDLLRSASENPATTAIFDGGLPLSIGGAGIETAGKQNWRGRIDEVRISSGLLPDDQLLIAQ